MGQGFVYDGVDLGAYLKCNFERPLAPPTSVETLDVPGRDGAVFREARLEPLDIPVHVRLKPSGTDAAGLRHLLAPLLVKREPKALVLPDEALTYYAVLKGDSALDRLWTSGAADLVFHCPDPVAYGAVKTATVPSGGSVTVTVGGNYPTSPTITAGAAVRNSSSLVWGVRLDGGDFVHVPTGSSSSRKVEVDCAAASCKVANSIAMITLDSDWLELTPGQHILKMDQGTGAATVKWIERWM